MNRHLLSQPGLGVVVLMAWFLISNHCAVSAFAANAHAEAPQMHCHGTQPAPSKDKGDENTPCCKVLKALETKPVTLTPNTFGFVIKEYIPGFVLLIASEPHGFLIACDGGPPARAFSFSESVLQKSILAHGPPSFC